MAQAALDVDLQRSAGGQARRVPPLPHRQALGLGGCTGAQRERCSFAVTDQRGLPAKWPRYYGAERQMDAAGEGGETAEALRRRHEERERSC
ncbi:hypothetical protein MRX96_002115 [Rhipicephalus microplus]